MPVDLKDLKLKLRRRIDLDLGGDDNVLTFWWSPDKYNDSFLGKVAEAKRATDDDGDEDPAAARYLAETFIVPLMPAWELTDDGKPHPITVDNVADLGIFVVSKMADAINEDAADYRELGKGSGGG